MRSARPPHPCTAYHTLQIGCEPAAEPVWYFDDEAAFARAYRLAELYDLPCIKAGCADLPEGEATASFADFQAYAMKHADPLGLAAKLEPED